MQQCTGRSLEIRLGQTRPTFLPGPTKLLGWLGWRGWLDWLGLLGWLGWRGWLDWLGLLGLLGWLGWLDWLGLLGLLGWLGRRGWLDCKTPELQLNPAELETPTVLSVPLLN
jgi:hypothetical protein